MLYIFTQDCGWEGSIVVVAQTEKAARVLMAAAINYDATKDVEKHDIVDGFMFHNIGDI